MFKAFENLKKFSKKFKKAFNDCIIGKITIYSDEYPIYNDLPNNLPDIVEGHDYVNHSKREYARGDVHVNSCENRHSFLRTYLSKYRGVSFQWLQGYLDFLALKLNNKSTWLSILISTDIRI